VSALAIAAGDTLYFDAATKLVNKTSSGNTKIGVATEAAANPSATVAVRLNGSF
jgi:predicted RecA/RadA family phage recombinase